jgi:hypothetical protein
MVLQILGVGLWASAVGWFVWGVGVLWRVLIMFRQGGGMRGEWRMRVGSKFVMQDLYKGS